MSYLTNIVEPLISQGYVARNTVLGCSDHQVEALMSAQGVGHLPERYVEFLKFGGKNPYWLSQDGEWDYGWLLEAKEMAREIVVDDYESDFTPFENAFIFQTHQGYMFYYFRPQDLTASDPTFSIFCGYDPVRESNVSFASWIRDLAESLPDTVELTKSLYGTWKVPDLGPVPGDKI
ncbi:SMI1/KNR4 family protein [Nocardia sp. NPDC058658]|uniref:SMI1/KNR4 family protein n=1 Tax=Nocardia sp. NPDC058658 TaxID=3346580 RepID=UPI00364EF55B